MWLATKVFYFMVFCALVLIIATIIGPILPPFDKALAVALVIIMVGCGGIIWMEWHNGG